MFVVPSLLQDLDDRPDSIPLLTENTIPLESFANVPVSSDTAPVSNGIVPTSNGIILVSSAIVPT